MAAPMEFKLPSFDKEHLKGIESAVYALQQTLQRYEKIPDPAMKFTLVLDKFLWATDMLTGFIQAQIKDYPQHLSEPSLKVVAQVRQLLSELQDWVMHPVYSPEHPFGQNVMQSAKQDFKGKTPTMESKTA
jgi:hypothetical protein